MIYQYCCEECGSISEYKSAFGQLGDINWEPPEKLECDNCNADAIRVFDVTLIEAIEDQTELKTAQRPFSGHQQFQLVGKGFSRQDQRIGEHLEEIDCVMKQEVTREEIQVGKELLQEREINKNLPEGYLSGERPVEEIVMKEISHSEKAKLDAQTRERVGKIMDIESQNGYLTPDQVENFQEGRETVVSKKVKKRGIEDLKKRAEEQRQLRQG